MPTAETVALVVVLHPKMTKKGEASKTVIDLDNCLKVALDALQGVAYENDKQVRSIRLDYGEPLECGGLSISAHRHADSSCKQSTDGR
jgi:crossover junction endodeoxyribonuclease RusA